MPELPKKLRIDATPSANPFGFRRPPELAVVTNTFPFETTGDDQPPPGRSTDQAMFRVAFQTAGWSRLSSEEFPSWPRNCGQSADHVSETANRARHTVEQIADFIPDFPFAVNAEDDG